MPALSPLTLLTRAERLLVQERWAESLSLLRRAARFPVDAFLRADLLVKQADCLRALGQYRNALRAYRTAQSLFQTLHVPSEQRRALLGASRCWRILSRYGEARRAWAVFEGKIQQDKDVHAWADVEMERALVARGDGRFSEARRRLTRACEGFSTAKDLAGLQHAAWTQGGLERFSGRLGRSVPAFQEAVHLARRLRDRSAEAFALCGLAGVQRVLGDGRRSLSNYRVASRLFQALGDPFGRAYGYCGEANALRVFGDARSAIPLYRRSAALYGRLGDPSSEGFAHWGLGGAFRRLKRWALSDRSYAQAVRLFRASRDPRGDVMARLGLARLEADRGHPAAAHRHRSAALSEARRHRLPYETALARYEAARVRLSPSASAVLLRPFGLRPAALRRWRDVP